MSIPAPDMNNVLLQLQATANQAGQESQTPAVGQADRNLNFADALVASLNKVDAMQDAAGAQAKAFERGGSDVSIANVMVDLEKAGLAFNMTLQARNRLVTAYNKVMSIRV